MKEVEESLEKAGDHFKTALLSGNYEFIECGECTAKILIFKKYYFYVWIANTPEDHCEFSGHNDLLMNVGLKTQKERMQAWRHIKPHVKKYREGLLILEKKMQIEKLEAELKELNS
jgi:hypothetical protein